MEQFKLKSIEEFDNEFVAKIRAEKAAEKSSVIPEITPEKFAELKKEGIVADGMIPKLTNAFKAIDKGVSKVIIKHARNLLTDKGTVLE